MLWVPPSYPEKGEKAGSEEGHTSKTLLTQATPPRDMTSQAMSTPGPTCPPGNMPILSQKSNVPQHHALEYRDREEDRFHLHSTATSSDTFQGAGH